MSLANMKELLQEAREQRRAVGAFSVSGIDMITGVLRAAEALDVPVILQVAEVRLRYSPLPVIGGADSPCARRRASGSRHDGRVHPPGPRRGLHIRHV